MKKNILLVALTVFSLAFAKAQSTPTPKVEAPQIGVRLGFNEMVDLGEVQLKFKKVISDSRCPKDVNCMWAGEAKIVVAIYKNGNLDGEKEITFAATNPVLDIFSSEVLGVTALALNPYPVTQVPKDKSDYYLVLSVTED